MDEPANASRQHAGKWRFSDAVPWSVRVATVWSGCLVILVAGLYLIARVATSLAPLALVLAATAFLAALLGPVHRGLRRLRAPSAVAALGTVLLLILAVMVPVLVVWQRTAAQFSGLPAQLDTGLRRSRDLLTGGGSPLTAQQLNNIAAVVVERARAALPGPVSGARIAAEVLGSMVLGLVLLFFALKDGETMWRWLLRRTSEGRRPVLAEAGTAGWRTLSNYVQGTMLVAAIDAAGIGAALVLLDVPLALPLTILTFLGGFVPIVGATVAGLLAVLVALAARDPQTALLTAAAVILVQQIEGNVLQPVIMRRQVRLHPTVILVAVTAGTLTGGIAGAFVAVPLVAVVYRMAAVARSLRAGPTDARPPAQPDAEERTGDAAAACPPRGEGTTEIPAQGGLRPTSRDERPQHLGAGLQGTEYRPGRHREGRTGPAPASR